MAEFRFAIIGAAGIANKFCDAVSYIENCTIVSVASKSMERAEAFAKKNRIARAYDDYETMLVTEKPDACYIAVTTNAHYEMCMLCLRHHIPFLCEKTMCTGSDQTKEVFALCREKHIFGMEAMWSRFLPAVEQAKKWVKEGRIGKVHFGEVAIGFMPPKDFTNRYFDPKLGGGAAYDLTVYCYELLTYLLEEPILERQCISTWSESGVDTSNLVSLRYEDALVTLKGSIEACLEEELVRYGEKGILTIPSPHFAEKAILCDNGRTVVEEFLDTTTKNGFCYEIQEVMDCIRAGKIESDKVPHSLTLEYAALCEELLKK